MSASSQPLSAIWVRARRRWNRSFKLSPLCSAARPVVEALERRQLLSVTSAVISAPSGSSVAEGNSAALLLTASTDNGDGTWWEVNTGDGTPDQGLYINGPGPTNPTMPESTEFDYTFPGDEGASYTVTAKVYDDNNPCGTPPTDSPYDATPQTIDITDAPITFNASDPFALTEGDGTTTLTLGTISDTGNDPSPDPTYSGTINWGNGSTSAAIFNGTTVTGVCPYTDEGTFTASVNVQDDGGQTASGSVAVNVADAAISASAQDPGAVVGQSFTSVVGSVTDQNPDASASDYTNSTIDWGDGTAVSTPTFQAVAGAQGTFNIIGTHTYANFGTYNMVVNVQDDGGSTSSATYTVYLPAPTINVGSVLLGPEETLDVPVSLSGGNNVASQALTIASYDSNVIKVAWQGGSSTDPNGNANLLVTGVGVGQTDIVVALANFSGVQGSGVQQVQPNNLSFPAPSEVCSAGPGKQVTATLTHPDGTPAVNVQLAGFARPSDDLDVTPVTNGVTDANGNATFTIKGLISAGEPDAVEIDETGALNGDAVVISYVTVVAPTITFIPSVVPLNYDVNGNAVPTPVTVNITDPTSNGATLQGVSIEVTISDTTVAVGGGVATTDAQGNATVDVIAQAMQNSNKSTLVTATLRNGDPNASGQGSLTTNQTA